MTQTKRAQGRRFEEIGDAAKDLGEQGTAPGDLVVAGVDLRVREDFAVEVGEERAEVTGAIGADVRGESVAEGVGEPADEGDVAEDVTAAKIGAVRFERIEPVRRKDDDAAAAFHDAMRFANCLRIVRDVFDDFVEQDSVEGVIGEGEKFRGGEGEGLQIPSSSLCESFELNVNAEGARAVR